MDVTVTVEAPEFQAMLERLLGLHRKPQPILAGLGMEMETRIVERFESRRDPTGQEWEGLTPATLKRKKGRGSTLVFTGEMQDSVNWRVVNDHVDVGFGKPYAAYHEWGTRLMPRRGMMFADPDPGTLGDDDLVALTALVQHGLNQAIEGR